MSRFSAACLCFLVLFSLVHECSAFSVQRRPLSVLKYSGRRPQLPSGSSEALAPRAAGLVRRQAVEQVAAVEVYGPVFAFAIFITVGGYLFAWLVALIIDKTDSYQMLGDLLAGEEEKKAFEESLKREQEEEQAEVFSKLEEKVEIGQMPSPTPEQPAKEELDLYRDY